MDKLPSLTAAPPQMRDVGDSNSLRKAIYDSSLTAVSSWPKLERGGVALELHEPHYDGPENFSLKDQRKAILERGTLGRRLRGTWVLKDVATGLTLDQKKTTIATIPYLTQRGTFINNGSEYALKNQLRLRPGVFTREKESGEIETHVNAKPGQGPSHRYNLDPAKGVFYANVGQANIPLITLLKAAGVSNKEMMDAWGGDDRAHELLTSNLQQDSPSLMRKYHERFLRGKDRELPDPDQTLKVIEKLNGLELDPEVTGRTMSKAHLSVTKDALLDITKKLLAVSRGEAETDDRDNMAYQQVVGPEDLISERLAKDYGGFRRKLLIKASVGRNLRAAAPNYLTPQVRAALLQSGLGQSLEETNLAEVLDKQFSITRMGEGGLGGDSIPEESRSVNDSQFSFVDPIRTPESDRIGIDLFLANSVKKGADGKIYAPFKDVRTGETVYRSPQDVADLAIAFPGELEKPGTRAWAIQKGRIRSVPKSGVALTLPHFEQAFSPLGNLIPFKSAIKGQRMSMGSRMITQALPVVNAEAPHVQSGIPGEQDRSYEQQYGERLGAVFAKQPGRVISVSKDHVKLQYADGTEDEIELADSFPFNRKSSLTQTPLVQPGQMVNSGEILAHSNFTDKQGQAALGLNARVALLPYDGANFEDAVVLSEDFAKRVSAENMYPHRFEPTDNHKLGRRNYVALFPQKYSRKQLESINDAGLVKPGTVVNYGDPLVLASRAVDQGRNRVHKPGARMFADSSLTWDHHSPGIITDAVQTEKGMTILVKSIVPTQVGDKFSGRWGNKGVVSKIVPTDQMPHDAQGRPMEVLLNPLGVISRGNPAQVIEMVLGKIAEKTGRPYRVPDFEQIQDLTEFAQNELAKHQMGDTEDLIDPRTGRKIPGVLTGSQFIMRLHHLAEDKGQGRGVGAYTMEDTPSKGEGGQAKRLSLQETNALLSHGAVHNLRDALQLRGQRNEDFWLNYVQGKAPPRPDVALVWKKFVSGLQGSGINVVGDANGTHIMALTDKDVVNLAADREITSGETVDVAKGFQPVKGGLFDPSLTGGVGGNRWGYISLPEPLPNPVMEDPIRYLLGLTKKDFEGVLAGRDKLPHNGQTGSQAIANALGSMNLPVEISRARQDAAKRRGAGRDAAVRRLGYLLGAQRNNLHPRDWMLTKAPVLPPVFRPVGTLGDSGIPLVADANYLYKELLEAKDNYHALSGHTDDLGNERLALYNTFKAVTGLGDPVSKKLQDKNVRGILSRVLGSNPKQSMVQRRLLSTTVDLVGRGVISPNPDLDMDQVGLPEEKAWDIYKNFVVRRLRRRGMPLSDAIRHHDEKTDIAKQELLAEMEDRPVLASRSPVLHRMGVMAFYPRLTKGSTIQVSPMIVKGFGADFDGDQMNFHVPVEEEARLEAIERMLPSRNLFSPADFSTPMHMPSQEYIGGLWGATRGNKSDRHVRRFATRGDVVKAWARGEIGANDEIEVSE